MEIPNQISFARAVFTDKSLDFEQKKYWLEQCLKLKDVEMQSEARRLYNELLEQVELQNEFIR